MKSWLNGVISDTHGMISSYNYSLHYATPCVWEGIRSYVQDDGTCKAFRLEAHIARLFNSAKTLGFEIPFNEAQVVSAIEELISANGNRDFYIRPVAYSTADSEGILSTKHNIALDIYCIEAPISHASPKIRMGISNVIRGYPQFQMQCKTSANYLSVQLAKNQMQLQNLDDVFMLDNQGHITEASVANVFVVKGDMIYTPPSDGSILPGITRQTVYQILTDPSIMFKKYNKNPYVLEKKITKADLYTADEVFLTGTYAEIKSVIEIDGRKIGEKDEKANNYTEIVQREYAAIVRGTRV